MIQKSCGISEVQEKVHHLPLPTRNTLRLAFGVSAQGNAFTGQYSYISDDATDLGSSGFGLMFYNARWYDPYLNHFVQADTIVPQEQGTQAWDRYAGMNNNPIVYKDPTGHTITQGDGGCTSKADCAVVSQAVIRDLINQGQIDEAIKLTVIYYRIDTHGASISCDKNNDEGLGTHVPGKITIGQQALRSPGVLGATLFHESIHEEQYQEGRGYLWMEERSETYRYHGNAINEVEAYDREISELSRFHLSPEDLEFLGLDGNRAYYYNEVEWNPILDQAITNGNYVLPNDLPDICVTDPKALACYYFNPANSPSGE